MRNWICATKFIICSSAALAFAACGSSTDSTTTAVGGAGSIGGSPAAGGQGTGGTDGNSGGAVAATGGAIAATGGSVSAGGTSATSATGGSAAAGGTATASDAVTMCDNVCKLLDKRDPLLACMPTDCVAACNSTYTKLASAKPACSDAYVALYQCGLAQPASSWECFTANGGTVAIDIPVPPSTKGTCDTQFNALYSILLFNMNTCGAAVSS